VQPPHTGRRYSSLPHWLAQRHQRREQAEFAINRMGRWQ